MPAVTVSIRYGRLPRPGAEPRRWEWSDVLERPPPSKGGEPEAVSYTVRHGEDDGGREDPHVRVAYGTTFRSYHDELGALHVVVDETVGVEPRVLSRVLAVETAVTRRLADRSRHARVAVRSGSHAVAVRVGGARGRAIETSAGITVGAIEWAGRTVRDTVHAVLEAPDRLWSGARSSGAHLSRRRERKELLRGLLDPQALSREGKAAALFLAGALLAATAIAATLGVALFSPGSMTSWRTALLFFALGVGSTVVFPFFPEFRLATVAGEIGPVAAVASVALGMTAGAWLVLFLGDAIHAEIRASVRPGSRMARALDQAELFAARHGFWAALLILAIPLGPDTPVFYVLATVRTPALPYLWGTLMGTTVRFALWLGATSALA